MSSRRIALLALLTLFLVAIGLGVVLAWHSHESQLASSTVSASTPTATATTATIVTPGECHSVNGLPDPTCTRYTESLKVVQIKAYGYADTNLADYEEDHLIPLELGGHPTDPKNLWPEPRTGDYPASKKDGVENSLHTKVCAGLMTVAVAQMAIAKNWESLP